jgi:hemerythrin superfamily protein
MAKKKVSSTRSGSGGALDVLQKDHKQVDALFKRFDRLEDGSPEEKEQLVREICSMLTVHAQIEEEIFYPTLRDALEDDDEAMSLLDEADVEHSSLKSLVEQLEEAGAEEDLFDARVTVLKEYVKHHVAEEEGELFPKAKKAKELDLGALGARLSARKAELEQELGRMDEDGTDADEEDEDRGPRAARGAIRQRSQATGRPEADNGG